VKTKTKKTKKLANKVDTHKKELLIALENTLGIVSDACKLVNLSRSTYYKYYNQDEQFKADADDVNNIALDFVESKLYKLIGDENITAIIFYLKTKGKKRGYSEKIEIEQEINTIGTVIQSDPISLDEWGKLGQVSLKMQNKAMNQLMEFKK